MTKLAAGKTRAEREERTRGARAPQFSFLLLWGKHDVLA